MAKNKPHTYAKKENGKNNVGAKEKYTTEFVTNELKEMLDYINSDDGSDVVFIGELCLYRGYSPQRWSEISLKHKENEEITETIKIIEAKLEFRLYKAGLTNQVNATVCLAGLNNKYRWENAKQKIEADHTSKGEKISIAPIVWAKGNE